MQEALLLEVFSPMMVVPYWFILYTLFRIKRHWNDGKDKIFFASSRRLIFKYFLCVAMVLVSVAQILTSVYEVRFTEEVKSVKIALFSSFVVSWIMSILMLRLENKLSLEMKWNGHRLYWPINFIIYVVLIFMETLSQDFKIVEHLRDINVIVDIIGAVLCLILCLLAFFKPNEFDKSKDEYSRNLLKNNRFSTRFSTRARNSMPENKGLAGAVLVSIKDYKIKVEKNKQIVFYNISVRIKGDFYKVRRTYNDFDSLYKSIRLHFPVDLFPYMTFPAFPVFSVQSLTFEEKTKLLNDFISSLCFPEFMIEATLDFLNIQGEFREKLLDENQEIIESERGLNTNPTEVVRDFSNSFSNNSKISVFGDSSRIYTHLHIYFQVSIAIRDSSKEFVVQWKTAETPEILEVVRNFREFTDLNTALKKTLSPATLPKFPTKSYVQNFRKADDQAVELRRRKLEKFLSHLLNDPAFQCQEILDFIDCKQELARIWEKTSEVEYEINLPVGWEGELDGSRSFIVYSLSFSKFFDQKKVCEWSVKRTFKDFEYMDSFLARRFRSPQIAKYYKAHGLAIADWPRFPGKNPTSLNHIGEIEQCKKDIEFYMEELCSFPGVNQAYEFKNFIQDPDSHF